MVKQMFDCSRLTNALNPTNLDKLNSKFLNQSFWICISNHIFKQLGVVLRQYLIRWYPISLSNYCHRLLFWWIEEIWDPGRNETNALVEDDDGGGGVGVGEVWQGTSSSIHCVRKFGLGLADMATVAKRGSWIALERGEVKGGLFVCVFTFSFRWVLCIAHRECLLRLSGIDLCGA